MARDVITRGGITIKRDPIGNLVVHCRGNGSCHVQHADIPDLILALQEVERTDPRKQDVPK